MRDGDVEDVALIASRREGKVGPFDEQVGPLAPKLERRVADERARQEACLTQDLEAIADAPDQAAAVGELAYLFHDRREARDCAGAQVVAVGKASGQDHAVASFEICVLVPEIDELGAEHLVDDPAAVAVGPRPWEDHHSELHRRPSRMTSKRKSSMTWFASSWRHISSTRSRASCSLDISRLSSMYLPTRTSETSRKPSAASPCLTVTPCGSLTTGLGVTMMCAIKFRSLVWAGTAACRPGAGKP